MKAALGTTWLLSDLAGFVAIDCRPDWEDVVDDGVYAQGPHNLHLHSPLGVMPQPLSAPAVPWCRATAR